MIARAIPHKPTSPVTATATQAEVAWNPLR